MRRIGLKVTKANNIERKEESSSDRSESPAQGSSWENLQRTCVRSSEASCSAGWPVADMVETKVNCTVHDQTRELSAHVAGDDIAPTSKHRAPRSNFLLQLGVP
jgi:hypothetical protein